MPSRIATILVLTIVPAVAQVGVGDIAIVGFTSNEFQIIHVGSGTPVSYNIGSYLGTGTSQSILADPNNPGTFYIGGTGFVGRATVTGLGTATWTLLSTAVNTVAQMDWDSTGLIIMAMQNADIRALDPVTGSVTQLIGGTQAWGNSLNALAVDPIAGDYVVGNTANAYRVPGGIPPGQQILGPLGGIHYVSGVAFEPNTNDPVVTVLNANRVIQIDVFGTATDVVPAGTIAAPNCVAADVNGDLLVGGGGASVWRIPLGGAAVQIAGPISSFGGNLTGITVVSSTVPTSPMVTSYGAGCPASNGTPLLSSTQLPNIGNSAFSLDVTQGAASSQAYLFMALAPANPPVQVGGCTLELDETSMLLLVSLGLSPIGPLPTGPTGATSFLVPVPANPALAGVSFYFQAAVVDLSTTLGLGLTNGLEVLVN